VLVLISSLQVFSVVESWDCIWRCCSHFWIDSEYSRRWDSSQYVPGSWSLHHSWSVGYI